ncbi:hypothetical protein [Aerolutibacter ruishenii]|uniref:PKD domain-containing protein n=1 Tax=Aerolutibacter ruishenii TaxID=686800 RepID=A0A562M0J6_9GAMM|nr:hypothetical protein [Lysobacter ruishenii]TWI13400.1 hypothetical protein IP93_00562 [Lysobacter ruishenii]
MIRNRTHLALAAALVASLAVVGCKKKEEPAVAPPPAASEPAPMPAPAPVAATASVTGVDLGTAVGADMKVTAPATTFKPTDTIFAAVATSTSDPMATVPGKLGAKWSFQDGQTVNEETVDVNLTGAGVTNFKISKPDGFPTGKYKLEVSQDGAVVQTREFEVK